jgi:glycerophosphoryl diester phosphodiesterase
MLRGRSGNPKLSSLRNWSYAHRGLHAEGVPENSMAAFSLAVNAGYGIELDVHLMADGKLAVIHDTSLKRTAGADICIEQLTAEDLADYSLEGTKESIPLFTDVLKLVDGKVPLVVEIKTENNNHKALTEAVCTILKDYSGAYCVESFDPRAIAYVRKHYPDFVRGQLAHNSLGEKSDFPWILRFLLTYNLMNFLVVPDFIAYRYCDRKTLSNFLCRRFWRIQGVSWTITDMDQWQNAIKDGWIPIFEKFKP